jgi:hypothetical protein
MRDGHGKRRGAWFAFGFGGGRVLVVAGATFAIALGAGCKLPKQHPTTGATAAATAIVPTRQGEGSAGEKEGSSVDLDERTGRPARARLVLRLDYFPEARAGQTNLPACLAPLPADFEVGYFVCDADASSKVTITAKNLDQECYTDPASPRKAAEAPVALAGCSRGHTVAYTFQPALRVDVEKGDIN